MLAIAAALVVAGLVGYLVKGSTTVIIRATLAPAAPVTQIQPQPGSRAFPDSVDSAGGGSGVQSGSHVSPDTLDRASTGPIHPH